MTTFYIARHGQTENNLNRRFSGWIDTPLTAEGIKNAKTSAGKFKDFKFDKIISSDLGRAFATAHIIADSIGYKNIIELNRGLREVNYGDFANMPYATYPKLSPLENAKFVAPGGESLIQMQRRVMACINDISLKYPDKTLLIVAHDGTMNALRASFCNDNIGLIDAKQLNNHDTVARFSYEGRILSFEEV